MGRNPSSRKVSTSGNREPRREPIGVIMIWMRIFVLILIMPLPANTAGTGLTTGDPGNTDTALNLLILFVSLALLVSFMCSVAEAVLLSITPSYIESLRANHPRRARLLRRLRQENVDRSLAAILTMNTIAHTVGAIEAGAQAAVVFGSTWVGIFSAIMTLMILFLSEIIPKTLGAVYWPRLVDVTMLYIRGLIIILYPLVVASEALTKLIARGKKIHRFSRDEFVAMAGLGEETGDLDRHESKIIRNLFQFRFLRVSDIMTPRTVMAALPRDMKASDAKEAAARSAFSRLPVYGKDLDDIKGFVLKDEILSKLQCEDDEVPLDAFKRDIQAVPESMDLPRLLEFLLDRREQIVVVVDEFGGTRGLVSLEDVMETLLGMEIVDEMDDVADMQVLARRQWAKRIKALGLEVNDDVLEHGSTSGDHE